LIVWVHPPETLNHAVDGGFFGRAVGLLLQVEVVNNAAEPRDSRVRDAKPLRDVNSSY
jgi:hypothetical protein